MPDASQTAILFLLDNIKQVVSAVAIMQNDRLTCSFCYFTVDMQTFFLFGFVLITPIVIQAGFSHCNKFVFFTELVQLLFGRSCTLIYIGGMNARHLVERDLLAPEAVHFGQGIVVYGRKKNMVNARANRPFQNLLNIFLELLGVKVTVGINQNI